MQRWTMARLRLAALSVIAALVAPTAVSASTDDMTAAGPKAPARSAETVYAGYWSGMMSRSRETAADCAEPAGSACLMVEWRAFMGDQAGRPALDQLAAVNDYVNRVRYRDDRVNWGLRDYWAAPREFFARGGDCEDFAIAKYLSLRALGFQTEVREHTRATSQWWLSLEPPPADVDAATLRFALEHVQLDFGDGPIGCRSTTPDLLASN